MPNRLLSIRGRNCGTKGTTSGIEEQNKPDLHCEPATFSPSSGNRPTTSGAIEGQNKRQKTTSTSRPSSSDGWQSTMADKRLQLVRVEDTWIGVASGSPTHPPPGWVEELRFDSTTRTEKTGQAQNASKWKKIGGLFKSRTIPAKPIPVVQGLPQDDTKLGLPIHRARWRNPRSPLLIDSIDDQPPNTISTPEFEIHAAAEPDAEPTPLPRLSIELPSTQLDRYSVMFHSVNGVSSLGSLRRKSTVSMEPPVMQTIDEAGILPQPSFIPNRTTTPTKTSTQYKLFPLQVSPKVNNHKEPCHVTVSRVRSISAPPPSPYGASVETFDPSDLTIIDRNDVDDAPSEEAYVKISRKPIEPCPSTTSNADESHSLSRLSKTIKPVSDIEQSISCADSVDEVSPQANQVEPVKPLPLRLRRGHSEDAASSPEDIVTGDPDDAPWLSSDSLKSIASSHTSLDEDIFFDLKALRDSRNTTSEYVISRPDSTAVQIARSISKKAKAQKFEHPPLVIDTDGMQQFGMPPDLHEDEQYCASPDIHAAEHILRLSIFDEAIAEVEKLTSPSDPTASAAGHSELPQITTTEPKTKPPFLLPTRLQGLAIGIPSPITEVSEEGTPKSVMISPVTPRIRHIVDQASPGLTMSPHSAVSSTLDTPPPVPEKDIKFLPVSKYAVRYEGSKSCTNCEQRLLAPNLLDKKSVRSKPVRQPTRVPVPPKPSHSSTKPHSTGKRSAKKPIDSSGIAVSTRPAAEVSVARQVSLSRKTSQRILVGRPGSVNVKSRTASQSSRKDGVKDGSSQSQRKESGSVVLKKTVA